MSQILPFPGSSDEQGPQVPRLDAAAIPHAIRHGAVLGALDAIRPGSSMDLVAPHDPKPLLAQAQARYEAGIDIEYLVSGPDEWVLRLTRRG